MKISSDRIVVALLLVVVATIVNLIGEAYWALMVLTFSLLGFREFRRLCEHMNIYPSKFWIRILITAFILAPITVVNRGTPNLIFVYQGVLIAVSFMIILLRMLLKADNSSTNFQDVAASIWAILYLGFLPSFFVWIRGLEHGFAYTMILVLTVSFNDTIAMLAGMAWGKTPLSPQISPKKTVEGSVAGLLSSTLFFLFLVKAFGFGINITSLTDIIQVKTNFSLWKYIPLGDNILLTIETVMIVIVGLILGVISQIGDLLESLFKRGAGVKDSGSILLSHGGILDRVDSHYFSAWFAYFIFYYLMSN